MKSIEVIVSPEGDVKIEAIGFFGQMCKKATEALEKALGLSKNRTPKKEYFQSENQRVGH